MATVERHRWAVARAGARGLVGAMEMTGLGTVTAAIGPTEESPPEAIIEEHAPELVCRLPERSRHAMIKMPGAVRVLVALDHVLYGVVVGNRLNPEPPVRP